ncbi:MAG: hypothetical protein V3V84_08385, partial [Candidatus Bathyarchaeia archaeon]
SENLLELPADPKTNTSWDLTGSTAIVNDLGANVELENLDEGSPLNFADFPIVTVVGNRYDLHVIFSFIDTEIQIEILDEDGTQIDIITSTGTGTLIIPFISTSRLITVRWKNVSTVVNEVSVISALTVERGAVILLKGTTNEVQYTFTMENPNLSSTRFPSGIAVLTESAEPTFAVDNGFVTGAQPATATNSLFQVYDTSLTVDHSSPNWEMINNIGDTVIESSARGGSSFTDSLASNNFAPTGGVFEDIQDGAVDIIYTAFTAREKCFLFDITNGMMKWTGVREKAQLLVGNLTLTSNGVGTIEVAVVINGLVQNDSLVTLTYDNQSPIQTLNTLPISRDLTAGDEIVVQANEAVGTTTWTVSAVHLSIA